MPKKSDREQWKAFRAEMIERDGGKCVRCTRSHADGHVMHVHHKTHVKGRMPWEYAYGECELLCAGCHAAEHGKIPPLVGWDYIGDNDLGDLSGTCEYCGQDIRYEFFIDHEKWEPLTVGTDCCDNLTGTELASSHMESINRYRTRRSRFMTSSRWHKTPWSGLEIRQKRMDIEIRPYGGTIRLVINGRKGKREFQTFDEAKAFVFQAVEDGTIEKYFSKLRYLPHPWIRSSAKDSNTS